MSNNGNNTVVYMVLGATGSIGSRVARRLAETGAKLVLAARDTTKLERLSEELQVPAVSLDATRFDHVEAALEQIRRSLGRLDGVVNCVGSVPPAKPITEISGRDWVEHIDANLTSAFATVRAAAQTMSESGGSVVLISAADALVGRPHCELFAAVKGGVAALTRAAAAGYAARGLRVNCVAPGPLEFPSAPLDREPDSADGPEKKPAGSADDVAAAVVWLLQPAQRWITGQVLALDGGYSTCRP